MYGPASSGGVTVSGREPGSLVSSSSVGVFGRTNPSSCGGGELTTGAVEGVITSPVVVGAEVAGVSSTVAVGASAIFAYGTNTIVPGGSPPRGCTSWISNAACDDPLVPGVSRNPQLPSRIG